MYPFFLPPNQHVFFLQSFCIFFFEPLPIIFFALTGALSSLIFYICQNIAISAHTRITLSSPRLSYHELFRYCHLIVVLRKSYVPFLFQYFVSFFHLQGTFHITFIPTSSQLQRHNSYTVYLLYFLIFSFQILFLQ